MAKERIVVQTDKDIANNKKVIKAMFSALDREPWKTEIYHDIFNFARQIEETDSKNAHYCSSKLRGILKSVIRTCDASVSGELFGIYKDTLLFDAKEDLDSFLLYLEINRPAHERFYQPRRKVLKPLVEALQQLADDELDELFLSMPPRVGKTTMLLFFACWIIGKRPNSSNLYSSVSDTITKAFYNGVLEILKDNVTYTWSEVFPEAVISSTNAQEETINIDRKSRYPSFTMRSLYGTLNGACDCNGILISDDLIGGIEEALNKDRMMNAWSKVDNNLIPRAKEGAKILWCGTRWSMIDPAGLRMDLLTNDERFKNRRVKIINVPALDNEDNSNFEYDYGVGFSSDYYKQRRASFERNNDMASWLAQYQGQPIEREGTLFTPQDMRYYNGDLPDGEPDRVFMAVDPAFGGGDFVASPVCCQYGDDIYVVDVVYSNEDKSKTQPLLAQKVINYGVQAMQIEATKATNSYAEGVQDILKKKGIRINLTTKPAPPNARKDTRIFDKAPNIRETMVFLTDGKRSRDYSLFMQNVFSFKMYNKNKHDDAPDSLAMAMDMAFSQGRRAIVFKRPF